MITVFTNGVFDILHSEHLQFLEYAKSLGDTLIVAINSDASTKRLKGLTRPIFTADQRMKLLMGLRCVDVVHIFNEDTPEQLIQLIRPDILIKGPEAANAEIPGAKFVESIGGKVITPNWTVTESTTKIIRRVLTHTDYPLPLVCEVNVKDRILDIKIEDYSLMFNKQPDGIRPVLYYKGKRVIEEWMCRINHDNPADKEGCSA